ncbi:Aste57867_15461 [Aphanomyces stellatus]|uniref:Mitogen-activated protein kinase n=1 Tax=Aphanomyces stellatus TaxID=120398 RepID=A0A485L3F8_9STRA|nr:hypothetical protein As57867_015405 [Aphanomyces stellatus]VFT92263.1 Aste57867_15461 [Aphanomyces stellatus]
MELETPTPDAAAAAALPPSISPSAKTRHMEQLPIRWEGYLRKRGEWLPRWDYYLVVLDGVKLSYYDRADVIKASPFVPSNAISLPASCRHLTPHMGKMTPKTNTTTRKAAKPRATYTVAAFEQDATDPKIYKFSVTTVEKRVLYFLVDTAMELVMWRQMIKAAIDQDVLRTKRAAADAPSPPSPPYDIDLALLYEAYSDACRQVGNLALLLPCLHPSLIVTSNYPPCVPFAGAFHGLGWDTGFLKYLMTLHDAVDVTHVSVSTIAREGDLAVVSGKETMVNKANKRRFRQVWRHELRFEVDGRVSHLNVIGDPIASSVAFSMPADGPVLSLPGEREVSSITCPPGDLRVVCVSAESLKSKKAPVVKFALTGFPHAVLKAGGGAAAAKRWQLHAHDVYATHAAKTVSDSTVYWAETLDLNFSGAVPGTISYLYVEVWADASFLGEELLGVTRVNLASVLSLATTASDEQLALGHVPTWYDLVQPDFYLKPDTAVARPSGRLQLSLVFFPREERVAAATPTESVSGSSPTRRKSFERLTDLHARTVAHATSSLDGGPSSARGGLFVSTASLPPDDAQAMHTFTVSGTKFRIYARYQLIRAIGHGAYGVVIAASDQVSGNAVAIKNIPKTFDDLVDAKRIVREIRLMRHLVHPHIVHVLDVMRPPSLARFEDTYIVTDLMETDLHRVIQSQERLDSQHIAYITYQMLAALRYMHTARVLHRDIKPSNVLVNRDCFVKICDFGLARGVDASDDAAANDAANALTEYVVTRWYRAPELLLSSKYSYAIDVWSVGCIIVEMFTRTALFPGHDHVHQLQLIASVLGSPSVPELGFITNEKAKRWMSKQTTQVARPWASVVPQAPPDALDLIEKLLTFDPRARLSVDDALRHPFVQAYRDDAAEGSATAPFDFSFEHAELDKPALQRLVFEDVCHFHPDARAELEAATSV